ncbi:MarR family transcriptional regulator [Sandarakinorhabdus sp.]|uniref:MarR family winged helix-turn-helix transcriptional regulator n=1 Tax=Sandarakinorhabdus sp. TaxID=1916663 RepID=UPI00286DBF18|nr:MarR family transcriptional regulator [Sandarakinorhabdus sp.]
MTFKLADFLPYQLSVASNAVSRAVALGSDYELRFGLSATEWRVLAAVTASGSATQTEVAAITAMDKMSVSRAVAGLTQRRLLTRTPHQGDRRTLWLEPTIEGRRIHDIVAPQALEVEAGLLALFTADEAAALRAALVRLREACDKQ